MSLDLYGGPADGRGFACARAPQLLRVVCGPRGGNWDCLDQLGDEPRLSERIFLYEQTWNNGAAFICGRGHGGYYASAGYRFIISCRGELDRIVRARESWRRFAAAYFGMTLDENGSRIADVVALHSAAR